ncbi:hypothetical protein K2173_024911 [Erythroxylum novogranatense]|uniref:NAD-dependent epimerase/dehydratase domain-containing protein n=1 Tax=Erythroxylum novogranatense TaxID=1862640 RepID=A0AAV8UFJ2_9ROSI|nr:hypothetical protein K2173_024911 [Erythroxylum novogranatense]
MNGEGKMVCVTGASGYIASWLVKCLLQRGYIVKATVLHLYDPNQTEHLLALDGATERLQLFEADLLKEGSFDPAVEGCEGVFHTASPVLFSPTNPQTELLDPAVKGTLNVLKSCMKVNSLKRVILTSSLVAVAYRGNPFTSDMLVDETWVSDPSHLEEQKLWYNLSKTLAEQAAWRFAKENRIDLVTIHPGFVIGPPLQPTLNVTLEMLLNLINGSQVYPNGFYRSVDVRNVADAHIQAFEIPSASGRYCLVGSNVHFSDLLNIVRQQYPELPLPEQCDYENDALKRFNVSQEKAKTLGINFTPLERMSQEERTVCVTGASGYIASWLVKRLLENGYTVKATVRDTNDPRRTGHLLALDGAKERLHLFKADLLEEGSFDPVVSGCEGVFHTASPVIFGPTDPQQELVEPALKGTLNVLKSCLKEPCLKRVILTSSMASVVFSERPLNPDTVVDETWFSNPLILEQMKLWYHLGKTLAENAAWRFAEENNIDLVTINPGFVIGPLLQPTLNISVQMVLDLINGPEVFPNGFYRSVDVRDVADAHIQAFDISSASGRYCLVGSNVHFSEILNIIRLQYPNLHLPEKGDHGNHFYKEFNVSQEKAKTLSINFTPLEVTLKDTIQSLIEKGFLRI